MAERDRLQERAKLPSCEPNQKSRVWDREERPKDLGSIVN